ncbi:FkbM family methyltransferase [Rubrivirga sp.]|uniref:FkbM family methyltransferase n=1 Tax=Rubrivirga sp. TaxID=1885344 RepID=UPI003B528D13
MRFVVEPGIGATYALGSDLAAPRHFAERVRPGMTVYDVGANKGQMALLFAALVGQGGRVVAFEPAPVEFRSLRRNVEMNGLSHVRLVNAAAADASGELSFVYVPDRPTQGKLLNVEPTYVHENADTLVVRATRLDDLFDEEPPPDVMKIDVEGAGASVLKGAARLLDDARPQVYIELHGPEEQAGVQDELLGRGYTARTLGGDPVTDPTDGWHGSLWCTPPRG